MDYAGNTRHHHVVVQSFPVLLCDLFLTSGPCLLPFGFDDLKQSLPSLVSKSANPSRLLHRCHASQAEQEVSSAVKFYLRHGAENFRGPVPNCFSAEASNDFIISMGDPACIVQDSNKIPPLPFPAANSLLSGWKVSRSVPRGWTVLMRARTDAR